MADRDDDLEETVDELARTVADLRRELESRRRSRFRPPTPGELLRFSDEVAIPTLLAILEANVRALEGLQKGIRLIRAEEEVRGRTDDVTDATRTRANDLRRTTLSQLDAALVELQRAIGEGTLPRDQGARELIEDARDLRDEIDRRLRDAGEAIDARESTARTIEIDDGRGDEDGATDADDEPAADVDIDAELETLKDQYAPDGEEEAATGDDGEVTGDDGEATGDDGQDSSDDETDDGSNGSDGPTDGRGESGGADENGR